MADISARRSRSCGRRPAPGFMDCKRALEETDGDVEAAVALLRERGQAAAAKQAGPRCPRGTRRRATSTPAAGSACSSRSTARPTSSPAPSSSRSSSRTSPCRSPACAPSTSTSSRIPADVLEAKRAELLADEPTQKKPEASAARSSRASSRSGTQQVCLLEQPFRDTEMTVRELITDAIATIGENIRVRRFARYELGEEL